MSGKEDKPMHQFKSLDEVLKSDKSHRLAHAANVVLGPPPNEDGWNLSLISGGMEEDEADYLSMLDICNSNTPPGDFKSPTTPPATPQATSADHNAFMDYTRVRGIRLDVGTDFEAIRAAMQSEIESGSYFIPGKFTTPAVESSTEDELDTDGIDPFEDHPDVMAEIRTTYSLITEDKALDLTPVTIEGEYRSVEDDAPEAEAETSQDTTAAAHIAKTASPSAYKRALARASYTSGAYALLQSFQEDYIFNPTPISQGQRFSVTNVHSKKEFIIDDAIHNSKLSTRYAGEFPIIDLFNTMRRRADKKCRIIVDKVYNPLKPGKVVKDMWGYLYLNTYMPRTLTPEEGDVSIWTDHLARSSDGDSTAERHLNWLISFWVQNPGVKIPQALIISGKEGTGKSTFSKVVAGLLGGSNVRPVRITDIGNRFNSFQRDCLALIINETDQARRSDWLSLKSMVSEELQPIEGKGNDLASQQVYCNYLFTTNDPGSLGLHEGSRRYFLIHSDERDSDFEPGYFERLHNFIDSEEGMRAILHYHLNYNLSGVDPYKRPPKTLAFERYARTHEYEWECVAADFIDDALYTHQFFTRKALREALEEEFRGPYRVSDHKLKAFLARDKQNLASRTRRVNSNPRETYYCRREHQDLLEDIGNIDDALIKTYKFDGIEY